MFCVSGKFSYIVYSLLCGTSEKLIYGDDALLGIFLNCGATREHLYTIIMTSFCIYLDCGEARLPSFELLLKRLHMQVLEHC